MKRIRLLLAAGLLLAGLPAYAGESHGEWLTDFEEAKRIAQEKNVPILANFAGSDWCGWCIKLESEVFSQDAFKTYAGKEIVLFLADFPMRKEQAAAVKQQNKALQKEYGVRGFPTVLLLDADGKVLARTGYRRGGPEKYVEHLKALLEKASKS